LKRDQKVIYSNVVSPKSMNITFERLDPKFIFLKSSW
jgi:hypothetical protein